MANSTRRLSILSSVELGMEAQPEISSAVRVAIPVESDFIFMVMSAPYAECA
jgi:hypothetical protein